MKALSVWQPWAWLIVCGSKDIENRTWYTTYRGPLAIHASLKVDKAAMIEYASILPDYPLPRGALVGKSFLADCGRGDSSMWAEKDMYHWVLFERRYFKNPVAWRGRQGLFDVPDRVIEDALNTVTHDPVQKLLF